MNETIAMGIFITLARIYDVQMALLKAQSPAAADQLIELHSQGEILTPIPKYTGTHQYGEDQP